ncbi:glycosyltransferase [Methanoregula sp.]|uniref:glycosyltransferase n=1 Tax=Methanoregula sp. TaxID=2052170 RepID=UPI002609A6BC|nr:glycosyltransferase [Methanoregula sp.]MDD5141899.1 glycosyltransferase [Methanoregula sp.]
MIGNDMTEKIMNNFQKKFFSDKVLLVLTPCYPNKDTSVIGDMFVKTQLDEIRKYFKKIIVISPILFSLGLFSKDRLCRDYAYENIEVYYPRCYYIPIFWSGPFVIDNRVTVIDKFILDKKLTFDLIHSHFTWPFAYIGLKLKEKYRKPVITTIHENGDWFNQEVQMAHPLINLSWSANDALIRVNQKDIPILQRYNKNVYAIPNAFSPAFHPVDMRIARKNLSISMDSKIIFSLGFLIKRKGFNYLIDAMKQISNQRPDVVCYIGGVGPDRSSLQVQIDRLNLKHKVFLLGSIPGDQLTFWINASDLFVLSSLNEGNPTVMFEVLGCGKPFIGTNVGGVPEVISSENYGILVEPANTSDLAKKIMNALDRDWDRDTILAYAEQYSAENIAKKIIDVYLDVLRRNK